MLVEKSRQLSRLYIVCFDRIVVSLGLKCSKLVILPVFMKFIKIKLYKTFYGRINNFDCYMNS